jgi:hypothetical protein
MDILETFFTKLSKLFPAKIFYPERFFFSKIPKKNLAEKINFANEGVPFRKCFFIIEICTALK